MKHATWILLKSILLVAAPAIIEMSLNTMLMLADAVMVTRFIGPSALSAVGIANSLIFTLIFVFSAFNTGAIAMISRSYGEKNMLKAREVAQTNIALNVLIGAGISLLAFVLKPLLFMPFDVTAEVLDHLHAYYDIIIAGMVFQFASFAFASVSRGVEDTKTPMYITGLANIVNIVFNYLLIQGIWIFPELGIKGAALATTGSRVLASLIYIYLLFGGKHTLKLRFKGISLKRQHVGPLWRISYPGAFEQFLMQTAFLLIGIIVTQLDTDSEALFRMLINIESTSFMPAVGISIAAATLVGKSLGEKNEDKAHAIGRLSGLMAVFWGCLVGLIFIIFPSGILSIFKPTPSILNLGLGVMLYMGLNQPLLNYNIAMSGALRGAGDTKIVMKLTSLRLWLIFLPGSAMTILVLNAGVAGVWYAEILSFTLFSFLMTRRFNSRKWALIEL